MAERWRDKHGDVWERGDDDRWRWVEHSHGGAREHGRRSDGMDWGTLNLSYGPLVQMTPPEPSNTRRSLHQHAAAIALALADAAADGYALYDNGRYGEPVDSVLLCGQPADSHTVIDVPRAEVP